MIAAGPTVGQAGLANEAAELQQKIEARIAQAREARNNETETGSQ